MCLFFVRKKKAGRSIIAKARECYHEPSSRQFLLGGVTREKKVSATVEKVFVILNDKEFEKTSGAKKKHKDPALPKAQLLNHLGKMEQCYIFQDPSSPFRQLRLSSSIAEEEILHMMRPESQLHQHRGEQIFEKAAGTRAKDDEVEKLIHGPPVASIAEYAKKLGRPIKSEQIKEPVNVDGVPSSVADAGPHDFFAAGSQRVLSSTSKDDELVGADPLQDQQVALGGGGHSKLLAYTRILAGSSRVFLDLGWGPTKGQKKKRKKRFWVDI